MRLIDADALDWECIEHKYGARDDAVVDCEITIDIAPTLDAVPVVRCKDCRYYQDNNGGYPNADCKWCKDETPDANDYCSCGERNEKEKGEY